MTLGGDPGERWGARNHGRGQAPSVSPSKTCLLAAALTPSHPRVCPPHLIQYYIFTEKRRVQPEPHRVGKREEDLCFSFFFFTNILSRDTISFSAWNIKKCNRDKKAAVCLEVVFFFFFSQTMESKVFCSVFSDHLCKKKTSFLFQ